MSLKGFPSPLVRACTHAIGVVGSRTRLHAAASCLCTKTSFAKQDKMCSTVVEFSEEQRIGCVTQSLFSQLVR